MRCIPPMSYPYGDITWAVRDSKGLLQPVHLDDRVNVDLEGKRCMNTCLVPLSAYFKGSTHLFRDIFCFYLYLLYVHGYITEYFLIYSKQFNSTYTCIHIVEIFITRAGDAHL